MLGSSSWSCPARSNRTSSSDGHNSSPWSRHSTSQPAWNCWSRSRNQVIWTTICCTIKHFLLIFRVRAYVTEIHQRSATIIQNQGKQQQAVGSAQPIGYDHLQNSLNEIKEGINTIKRDISVTAQRLAAQPVASWPTQTCLSTTIFAVFMVIQMVIMIGYFIYRLVLLKQIVSKQSVRWRYTAPLYRSHGLKTNFYFFSYRDTKEAQAKKFY